MSLIDDAERIATDLADLRHALHREPELGLHLPRTQARVLDALSGLPLEIRSGDRLSSVTAVLHGGGLHGGGLHGGGLHGGGLHGGGGGLHGGERGPTVLLRGDMDALPIVEQVDVPFRSGIDGTMHACGHDLHTSMLIGAAHLLASQRDRLAGDVVFMFQPGEEGYNGAGAMIDEGVLDASGRRPVAAYALHVFSNGWRHGTFASRPGPLMAASDIFTATVRGVGGHGSAPHNARDPIPAAAEMVLAFQTFLTRNISAFDPAVITVGQVHAGNRYNVIPETAWLEATVRTFTPDVQRRVADGLARLCQGIASAYGLEVETSFAYQYPVTVNSVEEADFAAATVADLFGEEEFVPMEHPIAGAEDFSRILEAVPGAMVFLGASPAGSDGVGLADNHSAHAAFDDRVLARGTALYAELATRRLARAE